YEMDWRAWHDDWRRDRRWRDVPMGQWTFSNLHGAVAGLPRPQFLGSVWTERGARSERRVYHSSACGGAARPWPMPESVRLLPASAGNRDALASDGSQLRECLEGGAVAGEPPAGILGQLPRSGEPSLPSQRQEVPAQWVRRRSLFR